ncbi:MAG: LysR family transcriptional regulator [Gammaproteobacteria bacterium]
MDSVAGMRILVRVVESGSFSAAARHLGVAPSAAVILRASADPQRR